MNSNMQKNRIRKVFPVMMGWIALSLCIVAAVTYWTEFTKQEAILNWNFLGIGIVFVLADVVVRVTTWSFLMSSIGSPIRLITAFRSWAYSQIAAYIPGKVSVLYLRIRTCGQDGVLSGVTTTGTVLEIILSLIGANILWLASFFFHNTIIPIHFWGIMVFLILLLAPLHPKIIVKGLQVYYDWLGVNSEPGQYRIQVWSLIKTGLRYFSGWFLYGMGGYCILLSIVPGRSITISDAVSIAGAFAFAWVIGYVSFFSPGGLAVREGALVFLLKLWIPVEAAVMVALLARLSQIIVHLSFAGAVWIVYYHQNK